MTELTALDVARFYNHAHDTRGRFTSGSGSHSSTTVKASDVARSILHKSTERGGMKWKDTYIQKRKKADPGLRLLSRGKPY